MRNIFLISLLLIITLTSCSPSTALLATVVNSASPTARILTSATHFSTPKPSAAIVPGASETPSPPVTLKAFKSLVSPDGELIANAYFEFEYPSGVQTIEIRDREGKLIWQIPYQGAPPTGDPRPLLNIFQWSNDSSQLFFYYVWSPDGGDKAFWWTGYDLQKFDVKTGDIQYLLPGKGFMAFAISPNGTQIAYTRQQDQPSVIHIRDLSTDSEKTAYVIFGSKNYSRVGDIHWSPSGTEIAFQTETNDYMAQTIYLNLSTMKQRVIREYELFTLFFQGWSDDGSLEFLDFNNDRNIVRVNPRNSETIVIGTSTPKP